MINGVNVCTRLTEQSATNSWTFQEGLEPTQSQGSPESIMIFITPVGPEISLKSNYVLKKVRHPHVLFLFLKVIGDLDPLVGSSNSPYYNIYSNSYMTYAAICRTAFIELAGLRPDVPRALTCERTGYHSSFGN